MKKRNNPVILALDLPSLEEAKGAMDKFSPFIEIFKIGPFLFYRYGWKSVELVKNAGKKVFLDLKLHDIPKVMGEGMKIIASQEVDFATIHLQAGENGVRKAVENKGKTKILGVTLLTSIDEKDLRKSIYRLVPLETLKATDRGALIALLKLLILCLQEISLDNPPIFYIAEHTIWEVFLSNRLP